jgi:hypothetical protein
MTERLTAADVQRLKRQAKKWGKSSGLVHGHALDQFAQREGFENWSLLAKAQSNQGKADETQGEHAQPIDWVMQAVKVFVEQLDGQSISRLCSNGSLWVDESAFRNGRVDESNFRVLDDAHASNTYFTATRLGLEFLMSFDDFSMLFLWPGTEDEDGNPSEPGDDGVRYTTETGRQIILENLAEGLDVAIHDLEERLNQRATLVAVEADD